MVAFAVDRCGTGAGGDATPPIVQLPIFSALRLIPRSYILQGPLTSSERPSVLHRNRFLIAALFALSPAALAGQGAFGSAIAIGGRDIFVGQPGNSYGPGVVYRFRVTRQGAFWSAGNKSFGGKPTATAA